MNIAEPKNPAAVKNLASVQYLWLTIFGGLFFHSMYYTLKRSIVRFLYSRIVGGTGGQLLTDRVVVEVSEKVVSIIYACICSVASVIVMWQARDDVLRGQAPVFIPFTYFIMWYFVYDLYAMYEVYCVRKPTQQGFLRTAVAFCNAKFTIVLHHLVILLIGVPLSIMYAWRNDFGDFIIGCFVIHDVSNPFLHTASILKLLNWTHTWLFRVTGTLTVCSFIVFRLLIYPFIIIIYAYQYELSLIQALLTMKIKCLLFTWSAFSLQLYWFFLLIQVLTKAISQKKDRSE